MKAIFSIVGILFFININAQKFDCSSKTKEYQDLFQAKRIAESYSIWSEVKKNCPKESEKVYTDGLDILFYKTDNATSPEEKEKLVREILKLYDQYNKYFPLATPDFEIHKAMALHNYQIDVKDEIFALLDSGFAKAAEKVTDATTIFTYFNLYYQKYLENKEKMTSDALLSKYMQLNTMLIQLESSKPEKAVEYKTVQRSMKNLAKEITACPTLAAFYENSFQANKDNADWLTAALTNMTIKCSGEPIYYTLAEANYKARATSKSAYYLAAACMKLRKFDEAVQYFTEAEKLETDPLEKAKLNYNLATGLLGKDKPKAKELLKKAIVLDPTMGKAYVFLAELYISSVEECGTTDFQKKAVYYLAIETLKKAKEADVKLKTTIDKMVDNHTPKSLSPKDITKEKMNGKSLKIECWINETITFPAK